uniref:Methyl-accepting chemotaxis sensory transducer n=1 Tax=Gloeothece verrucosa (strain PCC 7822) TaxID=497965 RepID=E0UDA7_GLOV7|nr:methyl-accepting chemotaxis sensory transducer [Gloeothece verrucosa PCC 7822]
MITGAVVLTALPVLGVTGVSYLGTQSLKEQFVPAKPVDVLDNQKTQQALERQLSLIAWVSGLTTLVSAAMAIALSDRLLRPILKSYQTSTSLVNRLHCSPVVDPDETRQNELSGLETNLNLIAAELPNLLWRQEAADEPFQVLMTISRHIWESFSEENVLRTTVEEVRQALKTDRVVIFRFEDDREGTFIAESVAPIWPKTLWTTINDLGFFEAYRQYPHDQIDVMDDIYQSGLSDEHIGLLERFAVKASLIAPIIRNNQVFGLLIAHECSTPRIWQQLEIDLFAQIANGVGFALDHTRLLEQVDQAAEQAQLFTDITLCLRESLREEDILKMTVEQVRSALTTDRVIVYSFDADWYGTVVAESVVPGFPKALWAKIKDPCFAENYVESYQKGRVSATNNIYEAGLTQCHLQQLEPFAVKANLVAPILKDDQLFGLLIAHECSGPRNWQQLEIDLVAQVATQVGFALDHARLIQRVDATATQNQLFTELTLRLRETLREEDILLTTVEEMRLALRTDRVIVYSFDADWYGTVVAESVVPGFPKALWAKIKDPCFAENYVESYQRGRVSATNNIYQAGLTECHLQQLEPFAVKANLVAPILKDDQLFGLLIAHQCSGPRNWQHSEIDLFAQIAIQVGFALDHARLLAQVEEAYQSTELFRLQQSQYQETLQRQVLKTFQESQAVLKNLSAQAALQMECVSATHHQIRAVIDWVEDINSLIQQAERLQQPARQIVQSCDQSISQLLENISTLQNRLVQAVEKFQSLDRPARKLSEVINLLNTTVYQVKLQTLTAELEASRMGESAQELSSVTKKANAHVRQLEMEIAEIMPLLVDIQTQISEMSSVMKSEFQQLNIGTQLVEQTRSSSEQMANVNDDLSKLIAAISVAVMNGVEISDLVRESVQEMERFSRQTSEESRILSESLNQLLEVIEEDG